MIDPGTLTRELLSNYRLIDLSEDVRPGLLGRDGQYRWGNQVRRMELREFVALGTHRMHFVETETHVGTHVELPVHIYDDGKSSAEMPLEAFWGEAIVLKFGDLRARDGQPPLITPDHLADVRPRDIVLMYHPRGGADTPALSPEAVRLLAELPIKMIGEQNVAMGQDLHEELLRRDIPIIERLAHLDEVRKPRVFFVCLPLRIHHLDSSWIRAVAFEPKG